MLCIDPADLSVVVRAPDELEERDARDVRLPADVDDVVALPGFSPAGVAQSAWGPLREASNLGA